MLSEQAERMLYYLEDEGWWEQWHMDGAPSPREAALILPIWLSNLEISGNQEETQFWAHRAANFYIQVQGANKTVRHRWGKPATYLPWSNFLGHVSNLPPEEKLLLFPGKFRTLPTSGHADTIIFGQTWDNNDWYHAAKVLVFEPKENVRKLEGDKLVFDPRIRAWAYSLFPIDIVTNYPPMKDGENFNSFYAERNSELRSAFSGPLAVAHGKSQYTEIATQQYKSQGIEVLNAEVEDPALPQKPISFYTTSELDRISSTSEFVERAILSYLRHMGQIEG